MLGWVRGGGRGEEGVAFGDVTDWQAGSEDLNMFQPRISHQLMSICDEDSSCNFFGGAQKLSQILILCQKELESYNCE